MARGRIPDVSPARRRRGRSDPPVRVGVNGLTRGCSGVLVALIEAGGCGVVGINAERPGGVCGALRVIDYAAARGMGTIIHNQPLGPTDWVTTWSLPATSCSRSTSFRSRYAVEDPACYFPVDRAGASMSTATRSMPISWQHQPCCTHDPHLGHNGTSSLPPARVCSCRNQRRLVLRSQRSASASLRSETSLLAAAHSRRASARSTNGPPGC